MTPDFRLTPIRVRLLEMLDRCDYDRETLMKLTGYAWTTLYDNLSALIEEKLVYKYLYMMPIRRQGRPRVIYARTTQPLNVSQKVNANEMIGNEVMV